MPVIVRANPKGAKEKQVLLEKVHFPNISFEEALTEEEGAFYIVIVTQPQKAGRVTLVSSDGKVMIERDGDRPVIVHPTTWHVGEAEME